MSAAETPADAGFVLRQKHFIDSHKCFNAVAILVLMQMYDAWSNPTAWMYLALHGTYGFLWTLKSFTFGDKQWEKPTPLWYGGVIWGALSLYWVAPWMICAHDVRAPGWLLALCTSMYAFGVFFHFAADMQKHVSLQLRPGVLFTESLWARCRNPNYLGELLIYAGFTALAMHWVPFIALGLMVLFVWVPNMVRKDRSLARYPAFAEWKKRSWLFLPPLW